MSANLNLCIVIPVFNHEAALPGTVAKLQRFELPIVLVDDGSHAACKQVLQGLAESPATTLITHEVNRGKGAAVKTGLATAQSLGFTHAIQVDADGQHDTAAIPRLVNAVRLAPQAMVAGIPQFDQSVPRIRFYCRYLTHVWVWINTLSFDLTDSMCGFRAYPLARSVALCKSVAGDRMDFDTEFLVRWHWQGWDLLQVPVRVHYPEHGVSHFRMWRDNKLLTWMHARLLAGMVLRMPRILYNKWQRRPRCQTLYESTIE